MGTIEDYHIHLYFGESTLEVARRVAAEGKENFDIEVGRFHEKNVGPHPRWSVQLRVPKNIFGAALIWVSLNRAGLTVFSHPNSGDDLKDHTDHAIWMGEFLELKLDAF